tara:strand:- start:1417 stop:1599 length:183 start_codon:yes stop_codon:yes gene_type:complete
MPFLFVLLAIARTDPWDASLENKISNSRLADIELARMLRKAFLCPCFNFNARPWFYLDAF